MLKRTEIIIDAINKVGVVHHGDIIDLYNKVVRYDVFPTILVNINFGNTKFVVVESNEEYEDKKTDS